MMLPINLFHRYFFFRKTNRKVTEITINDTLEYIMFFVIGISIQKYIEFIKIDPTNEYKDPEESYDDGEIFMLNVMW